MKATKKHYRIINQLNHQGKIESSLFANRNQLQRFTKSLIKQKKFVYIDINEDQGLKFMNQCQSSDDDDEVQEIGKKYIVNLNNLFTRNSKGLSYIYRYKQQTKKKDRALQLLKEELKRSTEKIEKLGKEHVNQSINLASSLKDQSLLSPKPLQRFISIKSSRDSEPTKSSPFRRSSSNRKSLISRQTLSYEKPTNLSNSVTPKKHQATIDTPYNMRTVLPDIKKLRKNIRL